MQGNPKVFGITCRQPLITGNQMPTKGGEIASHESQSRYRCSQMHRSLNSPKTIRFEKTLNNQGKYVKWASDYQVIKRESSETIRHTPVKVKT